MKVEKNICSLSVHSKIEANIFCPECKIFMCNKCEKSHSELFNNHHQYKLDKDNNDDIFTGFCKENYHSDELIYFCKNHNILCCGLCITKIKDEKNGKHCDCEICKIKDIEEEKKNKLKENIKNLEDLSKNMEASINELKKLFEKINENKENLKLTIQKIFTKIRNEINIREDELLLEVDKIFDKIFFKEELIRDGERLPKKIKISLEKGKIINNQWNNNKLNSSINDILNIENNIEEIKIINENLKKYNKNNLIIKFQPEENGNDMNNFLDTIKKFGYIYSNNYSFKKCPENINENRKFTITGEKNNIVTKTGKNDAWMGTICENPLEESKEHKWKIKILKSTKDFYIMVGVATINFDMNSASYETDKNFGWYYCCYDGCLYSGKPHNYNGKNINLKSKIKEITIIMNMDKKTLKFIIDNEDKGDCYTNIPLDKPIAPSVLLYNINDSVEIMEI